VQGWFFGHLNLALRAVLTVAALSMIDSGYLTDAIGVGVALLVWAYQTKLVKPGNIARGLD
jgi:TRAP-type uncharacterized transport system fused permease subunit